MKCVYFFFLPVVFIVVFCSYTAVSFPDPTDNFIDDDITLDEIFADFPRRMNLSEISVTELSDLPYFTHDAARSFVSLRDSLGIGDALWEKVDTLPELTPLQVAILNYLSQSDETIVLRGLSGTVRAGFKRRPEEEKISDAKNYFRIQAERGQQLSVMLLGERDAFEPRALDLFSANLILNLDNAGTKIVVGDYRPDFGQRLVLSRYGRSYMSGTDIMVNNPETVGNTFFEETLYMRGAYAKIHRGNLVTQLFSSLRNLDATLSDSGEAVIIDRTGYHSSGSDRGNLRETITAGKVSYSSPRGINLGAAGVYTGYSPALSQRENERYINYPEGSTFRYVSLDGEIAQGPAVIFFEHARGADHEHATIGGLQMKTKTVRTSVLMRNYSERYWSLRSGAFSSFGNTTNERGVYSAIRAELPYSIRAAVSMDLARTLSRTFTREMTLSRRRLNFLLESTFRKGLAGKIIVRTLDDSDDGETRRSYRLHLIRKQNSSRSMGWRSVLARSESGSENGQYGEIAVYSRRGKFRYDCSVGFYYIPSYSSRFYRYEYDVPGHGLSRAVWGKGGTVVVVCGWRALSCRYRVTDSDLTERSSEFTLQGDVVF